MSDKKVVPINGRIANEELGPSEETICLLEKLLESAKAGTIKGLAIVYFAESSVFTEMVGDVSCSRLGYGITLLYQEFWRDQLLSTNETPSPLNPSA